MSKKLKVGIVGTGNICKSIHIRAWTEHPETEVIALCDIVKEKAEKLAAQYDVSLVTNDYRDLLEMQDIDIIDICTSNIYHSEVAIAALQAGKHVFCEKPDAINPEQARKMADAAKNNNCRLMVMRNNRFRPETQYIKQFVDAGHAGEIYTGRCGWVRTRGIPGRGGWFTNKEISGGGPLIDLGVHFIDLAMWFMGNPKPVAVSGATYSKFADTAISDSEHSYFGETKEEGTIDVEDLANGFIRFENGATLQIEFSWASNVEEEMTFVELRGTKAGIILRNSNLKFITEVEGKLCDLIPQIRKKSNSGHHENIYHFIDVLQGRKEPIFVPENGVDMITVLSAIYESARIGAEVRL